MKMIFDKNGIWLLFTFYRNFFLLSIFISLGLAYPFWKFDTGFPASLILFKLISFWLIYYFLSAFKKKEWYYFRNLGYTIRRLFLISFCLDFLLFVLFLYLVTFLR
jgi:hypothetical protein